MTSRLLLALALSSTVACGSTSEVPPPASAPLPPSTIVAPPPTTNVAPPPTVTTVTTAPGPYGPTLAALPGATAIRVTNGWMGLSPIAPIAHHYELTRTDAGFVAHLVCRARGEELAQPEQTISADALAPILAQWSAIPVTPGTYRPRIQHTDDYPDIAIEIDSPAGTLALTSRSQGVNADPWQITVGTDAAIVDSTVPGEAMAALGALIGIQRCHDWERTVESMPRRTTATSDGFDHGL